MRNLAVTITCDRCDAPIADDGGYDCELRVMHGSTNAPVTIDVCPSCREELDSIMMPLLRRGIRINGNGRAPRDAPLRVVDCPDCGRSVKAGAGLTLHQKRKHPDRSRDDDAARNSGAAQR